MYRNRRGYALLWVIMLFGVIAAVFAASVPTVVASVDRAKVAETYAVLHGIDSGVLKFGKSVKRVGTVYPLKVHSLAQLVQTTERISCGTNLYNTTSRTTWTDSGPFMAVYADPTGVSTPMGDINDSLEHGGTNSPMYIRIPNADANLVVLMDQMIDAGDLGAAGKVLYGAPVSGVVDLRFRIGVAPAFTLAAQC